MAIDGGYHNAISKKINDKQSIVEISSTRNYFRIAGFVLCAIIFGGRKLKTLLRR